METLETSSSPLTQKTRWHICSFCFCHNPNKGYQWRWRIAGTRDKYTDTTPAATWWLWKVKVITVASEAWPRAVVIMCELFSSLPNRHYGCLAIYSVWSAAVPRPRPRPQSRLNWPFFHLFLHRLARCCSLATQTVGPWVVRTTWSFP